jgi:prevent-host-death family protein
MTRSMAVREAKACLSAVIDAASHGEPTIITRHGQPAAVVVSVADAARLFPITRKNFADHLLAFPGGLELERDTTPLREVDW